MRRNRGENNYNELCYIYVCVCVCVARQLSNTRAAGSTCWLKDEFSLVTSLPMAYSKTE